MSLSLSQKEKMLLQDQKSHEEMCVQKYTKYANEAKDPQLKQLFNAHASIERQHLNTLNQILSGQVPGMNQQQGQTANQNNQQTSIAYTGAVDKNDISLCNDMLTTEKYVSHAYDTVIFECIDAGVRQTLNHIQQEEQQHGQDLFAYLQNQGAYNVQ